MTPEKLDELERLWDEATGEPFLPLGWQRIVNYIPDLIVAARREAALREALVVLRKKVDERLRGRVIGNYAEVTEQQDWMAEGMSFARNAVLALIDDALLSEVPQ